MVGVGDSVCPYACWSKSSSSLTLTDANGETIFADSFHCDFADPDDSRAAQEAWTRKRVQSLTEG